MRTLPAAQRRLERQWRREEVEVSAEIEGRQSLAPVEAGRLERKPFKTGTQRSEFAVTDVDALTPRDYPAIWCLARRKHFACRCLPNSSLNWRAAHCIHSLVGPIFRSPSSALASTRSGTIMDGSSTLECLGEQ